VSLDKGWREKRIREAETAFDGAVELGQTGGMLEAACAEYLYL
jgi:hypothetical protein